MSVESESDRWDAFVSADSTSSFCHLSGWRDVMTNVFGHDCYYWAAVDSSGEWQGVLPLVHVRGGVLGDQLVSMPFLNYGGPLGTRQAREFLAAQAVVLAQRLNVKVLELRSRSEPVSNLADGGRKVTVTLPLAGTSEQMFSRTFTAKLRSQIRRPQKVGMESRFGSEHLPAFYDVYARNMRDLGTPVLPWSFFAALQRAFPQLMVSAVYANGHAVAAGCGFLWNDEFEITWASSLREYNTHAPNMLLYWAWMEHLMSQGVSTFNFGRCTPDGGTHRFKLQWGGTTQALPWRRWSRSPDASGPSQDQLVFKLATRMWSRMPLAVANRLGPWLARSLP